jgi:Domain of unknown function (DUF4357)
LDEGGFAMSVDTFGQTIQLFLVDGTPSGLRIASIHGWTGQVLVASQSAFKELLTRPECDRTGLYVLFGPDPDVSNQIRAYIGEADIVAKRVAQSANERAFWETALVVTTSDDALTKGDVRYLEARLIELANTAGRVSLDNANAPSADQKRLTESGKANMEAFLGKLRVILPVVGLEMLKPTTHIGIVKSVEVAPTTQEKTPEFDIQHKSGIRAHAIEQEGEFIVLGGSQALKNTGYVMMSYGPLKDTLIQKGILVVDPVDPKLWKFSQDCPFRSPSAAAAVILDRNSNGRTEWRVKGMRRTYAEWQVGEGLPK